ncbi:MAG: GntR family transcriptional regulator [Corynebacterium sp.]|uniref:GntR family transcriptional regulator n=1 Tax=Corynebacterium sp. TaxID=1720 RepID=UPI003F0F9E30
MTEGTEVLVPTKDAYRAVRTAILRGGMKPGERLSPSALGKELGVSAGVVREALTRLASERLVSAERNKGFRVYEISLDGLKHLAELRQLVEGAALEQSIEAGDVTWESEIIAAHHLLLKSPGQGTEVDEHGADVHMMAHRRFHMALLSACPNPMLLDTCRSLWDAGELYRRWGAGRRDSGVWMKEHEDLVTYCVDRDVQAATDLLRRHIGGTVEAVTALLNSGGDYPVTESPGR